MSASVVDSPALARTAPGMRGGRREAPCGRRDLRGRRPSSRMRYGWAQKQPWRTPMPYSALSRAATSAWGTPSTTNVGDGERGVVERRPEQAHARRSRPGPSRSRRAELRRRASTIGVPADVVQLVDGGVQRDRADDVGRAGLLALGRVGPHHLVEVDEVDRAAAGEERVARRRTVARGPMSTPAPNGAYILWPLHATKSALGGSGRCGASWAASTSTGTPRSWAAAMISSIGGSQPGDVRRAGDREQPRRGAVVERGDDVVDA